MIIRSKVDTLRLRQESKAREQTRPFPLAKTDGDY